MLTEDILHDLQKRKYRLSKEYTRQIYDTNAFLSTGSCLRTLVLSTSKLKENPCVKGILWIIPLRFPDNIIEYVSHLC